MGAANYNLDVADWKCVNCNDTYYPLTSGQCELGNVDQCWKYSQDTAKNNVCLKFEDKIEFR